MVCNQCDNCKNSVSYIEKVDFGGGGIPCEDCLKVDVMTDEDCELADKNECPYYEKSEDEE